jgi:hypothetical protein
MSRYCQQRESATCGPVAILNTLKWLGYGVTYKYVKQLIKAKEFHIGSGISSGPFDRLLRQKVRAKITTCHHPTMTKIRDVLYSGGAVILLYLTDLDGHYIFIPEVSWGGHLFTTVNNNLYGKTVECIAKQTLQRMLRRRIPGYPKSWFIYPD